ncbi:rhodanese-like domain-containing protein [Pseudomonadales bacterium]|nr:rhodanese-like domain-containing protein [Pseudomonadales bacterium]
MQKFLIFVSEQWFLITVLAATVALLAWLENRRAGKSLSTHALTALVNRDNGVVIDLRDKVDFDAGHIVDAINVPFTKWQSQHTAGGKTDLQQYGDRPLVLVCKMGQQSSYVAKRIQSEEGPAVYRLAGGLMEWQGAQMPLVK